MSDSKARELVDRAAVEEDRVRRHLLIAAALTEVLTDEPVIVGGVAEDYWAAGVYKETDLDLCVPLNDRDIDALRSLGFEREGRHWYHPACHVAVEFPDDRIDGDIERTVVEPIAGGRARIIGVEDLYLDRVRQATMNEGHEGVEFMSALAIAAARFDEMDWSYIRVRIRNAVERERLVGEPMQRLSRRIRRRARLPGSR